MSAVAPEGRRLPRVEASNAAIPVGRKPSCMRHRLHTGSDYTAVAGVVNRERPHTVCQEARCPNIFECWEHREATFLIGGDQCTRRCDFCQIATGRPQPVDPDEPRRMAESVVQMSLLYATVTWVTRDDLHDEGAWLWAGAVPQIDQRAPGVGVEIVVPDFSGRFDLVDQVLGATPDVFAHNIETVPRIFRRIRTGFRYERLEVFRHAAARGAVTKSNPILGKGEEREEVVSALAYLRAAGCRVVTITQYPRPSVRHHSVSRWVEPGELTSGPRCSRARVRGRDERPPGAVFLPRGPAPGRGCASREPRGRRARRWPRQQRRVRRRGTGSVTWH